MIYDIWYMIYYTVLWYTMILFGLVSCGCVLRPLLTLGATRQNRQSRRDLLAFAAKWLLDVVGCDKLPTWEDWILNVAIAPLRFGGVYLPWPITDLDKPLVWSCLIYVDRVVTKRIVNARKPVRGCQKLLLQDLQGFCMCLFSILRRKQIEVYKLLPK